MTASSKLIAEFPTSISKAVNWKVHRFYSSNLTPNQSFNSPPTPKEVQKLVQDLAKFDGVARVRAVAPRAADIHWIDFELELHPETELDYETWDKIQDLVIDCEWDLRDKTNNEKWYFERKTVEKFSKIQEGAKVVAKSSISYSSSPKYYMPEKSSSNFLVVA